MAGICDPTGRVFGLMPHPEAYLYPFQHPQWTRKGLAAKGDDIPLVMVTAYADVPMAVRAIANGALDYLVKPFAFSELLARVQALIRRASRYIGVAARTVVTS